MDQFAAPQHWARSLKILVVFSFYLAAFVPQAVGLGQPRYVEAISRPGSFTIAKPGTVTSLCVDEEDHAGVVRAIEDLKADIRRVTGQSPVICKELKSSTSGVILIGTIGKSHLIDGLIRNKKINVTVISGKWESFLIQ